MRSSRGRSLLAFAVVAFLAGAEGAWAQGEAVPPPSTLSGALDRGDPRVEAELLADVRQVAPGGTFRIGVRFRMDPNWHIYWRNPGEAGLTSEVEFQAPGLEFSSLRYPFPETFRTADGFITTYGYADEVLLFTEARASPDLSGETVRIHARVDVLACDVNCIPAKLSLSRSFPVGPSVQRASETAPAFDAAQARVPQAWTETSPLVAALVHGEAPETGKAFVGEVATTLEGWKVGRARDFFVPDENASFQAFKLLSAGDGRLRLEGELAEPWESAPRVKGVAHVRAPDGQERFVEVDVPLVLSGKPVTAAPAAQAAQAAAAESASPSHSLAWILLLAFLGGALLNLMPCVFPVLALKAYGFARLAHEGRGTVAAHALAYAGGVIGSMLLLAGGVTLARWGGTEVGWGFQFQEPLFVAAVSAIVVAFALNLFGVFHVGFNATGAVAAVDHAHGLRRSVGEGVLAVLLATPCSAPLLGTAVGFAFAAGTFATFAVFVLLGVGLAAPFCVLILVPGLAKRLPKPGMWMERLKQLLGFALLGTAVWLLWVMGGLTGTEGMGRLAAFLALVALATWLFGWSQSARPGASRWSTRGLAAAVLALSSWGLLDFPDGGARPAGEALAAHAARPWSEEAVQAALAEGRPVFVDFTADWCLTCKFNERTVLASDAVTETFMRHNVALFVADWTRRDEPIRKKLAEYGRAGVPMYLVMSPAAGSQAVVLPELLTPELVIEAIAQASPARSTQAKKD